MVHTDRVFGFGGDVRMKDEVMIAAAKEAARVAATKSNPDAPQKASRRTCRTLIAIG